MATINCKDCGTELRAKETRCSLCAGRRFDLVLDNGVTVPGAFREADPKNPWRARD